MFISHNLFALLVFKNLFFKIPYFDEFDEATFIHKILIFCLLFNFKLLTDEKHDSMQQQYSTNASGRREGLDAVLAC